MNRSRDFDEGGSSNTRRNLRRCSRRNSPSQNQERELNEEERYYFRNTLAQERYNSHLRSKNIVPSKRFVGVSEDLQELFVGRNWMFLIQHKWRTNNNLVREFYANLEILDPNTLSTYIRSTQIILTSDLIAEVLRIPRETEWVHPHSENLEQNFTAIASALCGRECFWDGSSVLLTQGRLSIISRLLHFFVGTFVLPVFHTGNVTIERALAILTLLENEPFDLAGVIFDNMKQFCVHQKGSLGYGYLITALAHMFGVVQNETDVIVAPLIIDGNTIAKSRGQRANVVVSSEEDDEDEEGDQMEDIPPQPEVPQYGEYTPYPQPPVELPRYLHRTYDIFAHRGNQMQKGLYEIQQEQIMSRQSNITIIESLAQIQEQMQNLNYGGNAHFQEDQGGNSEDLQGDTEEFVDEYNHEGR